MNTEPSINKRNLRNGERYTFYLTYDDIIRGTFDHYVNWNGVPNDGLQISNFSISPGDGQPFQNQDGLLTAGLDDVNKVTQYNIGPGTDVNKVINSFYGGRKSKKSKKSRKSRKSRKFKRNLRNTKRKIKKNYK